MKKKISVIMGIYNCADTLPEAIESLRNQTYSNWNLIMCDDGSTDRTYEVAHAYLERYPDKIILIKNETNQGLNYTLNRCLEYADGDYIARMDGDDISLPERFEREAQELDRDPSIAIVSCDMIYFDAAGDWGRSKSREYPQDRDFICSGSAIFGHAPCMVRREAYEAVEGYTVDRRLLRVEDYHLWGKMYAAGYRGKNIQEPLYKVRDDRDAMVRRKYRYRLNAAYVHIVVGRLLKFPAYGYLFALYPLVKGLIPRPVYRVLHRMKLRGR